MHPDRATALLAVVRIISVLGMSFAIAAGIFLLLWGKVLICLIAFVAAVPFFFLMRLMEKRALEEAAAPLEPGPAAQPGLHDERAD